MDDLKDFPLIAAVKKELDMTGFPLDFSVANMVRHHEKSTISKPPKPPRSPHISTRQEIIWRCVGYFEDPAKLNELRHLQRCSRQRSCVVSDGYKVTYRCNRWKTCRCKYQMFAHFDSIEQNSGGYLYEAGRHVHIKKNRNVLPPHMKAQLVEDNCGAPLPKGRRRTKNAHHQHSLAQQERALEELKLKEGEKPGPSESVEEDVENMDDEDIDVGVNEPPVFDSPEPPTTSTPPAPASTTSITVTQSSSHKPRSSFNVNSLLLRQPKVEAIHDATPTDVRDPRIVEPPKADMSILAPPEPNARASSRLSTSSARFSLGDGDVLIKLLMMTNQLGFTLSFDSSRPGQIRIQATRDERRHRAIVFQESQETVTVSRYEGEIKILESETWTKADWSQFSWAARGICCEFL